MTKALFIILAVTMAAGAASAEIAPPDTAAVDTVAVLPVELGEEYFARLDDLKCTELSAFAYKEIPDYVLNDRPDLLYEFVLYWEYRCLSIEPAFRARILGSIWDGAFDESQYGEEVIDRLIDRYDPPVKSKNPQLRKSYDQFTTSFADQMLPHVPYNSLEEFFCLFYSGKTTEAWSLLESEPLEDTWLRFYYDAELMELEGNSAVPTLAATAGAWWPSGNMSFVGDKPLVGILAGVRWPNWLARFVFEVRVGRSDTPYLVDENGITGRSDRFDATLVGGEFGRILLKKDHHNLDLFLGVGLDGVKPFKDADLILAAPNLNLGLGYRLFLGKDRNWTLGLDVRHEWIGERNEQADSMSGQAWSARFCLGYTFNEGRDRRLRGLGQ